MLSRATVAGAIQKPTRNVIPGHLSLWPQPWSCSGSGSTDGHLEMPANGNFVMRTLRPGGIGHMLFVFKSTEKSATVATRVHHR